MKFNLFILYIKKFKMECPICYENKDTKKFYNCNHLLCNECYNKWINGGNVCPECRA